ncbi:ABC transporter ATP-binding protein [Dactylosporangium sp. CA-092794]|uniref:ABC transporter ATP-binding protein n=1 Tax=Dactylosporangium sp. CA-092794 TaxID=3239929 RepID=UPI003D8AA275
MTEQGQQSEPLFAMSGVSVRFGGIRALTDVSLQVRPHDLLGLIGPNGAGKTTAFNVLCGFVTPNEGELFYRGEPLPRARPWKLAEHRIARTLQALGLFDRMTVLENVMVGADIHAKAGFWSSLIGGGRSLKDEKVLTERAHAVLEELDIAQYAGRLPTSLPYPIRKRVALARALAIEPELLLLDEPASGLSNDEMDELGALIKTLTSRMAVMLVEHHMDLVMSVCDYITVLDFGRVVANGTPDEIRTDPVVLAAYLGEQVEHAEHSAAEVH